MRAPQSLRCAAAVAAAVAVAEVMPIHCAAALESSSATKDAFGGKNCRGGPWLPRDIEISLLEREDGESEGDMEDKEG